MHRNHIHDMAGLSRHSANMNNGVHISKYFIVKNERNIYMIENRNRLQSKFETLLCLLILSLLQTGDFFFRLVSFYSLQESHFGSCTTGFVSSTEPKSEILPNLVFLTLAHLRIIENLIIRKIWHNISILLQTTVGESLWSE